MDQIDTQKVISRWRDGALAELKAARGLLETGNQRQALFWCHLAIEKALKAHVVKSTGQHAPFTHSLGKLISLSGVSLQPNHLALLDELNIFQTESRYDNMEADEIIQVDLTYAQHMLSEVEEIVQCLTLKL